MSSTSTQTTQVGCPSKRQKSYSKAIPSCSQVDEKPASVSTESKPLVTRKTSLSSLTSPTRQLRQTRIAALASASMKTYAHHSREDERVRHHARHASPSPSLMSCTSFTSLTDSSTIRIRQPPSILQRTESNAIENEVLTLRFLTRITIPVPEILRLLRDRNKCKITTAILDKPPGMTLGNVRWLRSDPRHRHVQAQISAAKSLIARARSRAWGPLASVCGGTGCATWREAFLAIFDALLFDAEDSWVNLPYPEIRQALVQPWAGSELAKECQLVIPGFGQPERVLVDEQTGNVTAYVGFREAFWGDPEMVDAKTKKPLYRAYQALRVITMQSVRPTSGSGGEVITARTKIMAALAELNGASG